MFFFSVSLLTSTRFLCFGPVVSLEQYGSVFKLKQVVSEFWQTKIYCDHPNHGTVVKRERNDTIMLKNHLLQKKNLAKFPCKIHTSTVLQSSMQLMQKFGNKFIITILMTNQSQIHFMLLKNPTTPPKAYPLNRKLRG